MEGDVKIEYTRGMIANIHFSIFSLHDRWSENSYIQEQNSPLLLSDCETWSLLLKE